LPGVEHRQHRYLNTVRRIRISPRDSGSSACRDSRHRDMPNGFSRRMA
jgi:hypothetical protein